MRRWGFGVTLDLDALDPVLRPPASAVEPDGLGLVETLRMLRRVAETPGLRALEIVEYNPDRDRQGRTAHLITTLIEAMLPVVRQTLNAQTGGRRPGESPNRDRLQGVSLRLNRPLLLRARA